MAEMSTPIGVTSGTLGAQRSDIVDFNRCGRPYVQLSMPHFSPPVALEEMAECNSTQTHADMRGGTVGEPSSWRANLARKISCVPCFYPVLSCQNELRSKPTPKKKLKSKTLHHNKCFKCFCHNRMHFVHSQMPPMLLSRVSWIESS